MGANVIDIETLTSNATRAWEEKSSALNAVYERSVNSARESAEWLTKAQLVAAIVEAGKKASAQESKPELVKRYVSLTRVPTDEEKELKNLEDALASDQQMARSLNAHIKRRDEAFAAFKGKLDKVSDLVYEMSWRGDSLAVLGYLDRYVQRIIVDVNEGGDIREVAQFHAEQAFRTLARIPSQMLSNTRVGAGGAELLYEAAAAQKFLSMVGRAYGARNGSMSLDIINAM